MFLLTYSIYFREAWLNFEMHIQAKWYEKIRFNCGETYLHLQLIRIVAEVHNPGVASHGKYLYTVSKQPLKGETKQNLQ